MAEQVVVQAAGGVVRRTGPGGRAEVLLVHRPRYDDWSFPKGKLDAGESHLAAAVREVGEETGLEVEPLQELPSTSYRDRAGRPKVVRYWLMSAVGGAGLLPNDEIDRTLWLGVDEARRALSYEHDRRLLDHLDGGAGPVTVYLVRHGSAGERDSWDGPDRLRPLDPTGHRQAGELADLLAGQGVDRVLSSPFVRCVQTVEPLAARLGLGVEQRPELAEGADADAAVTLVRSLAGTAAVLCTHGDVVPTLLERLEDLDGLPLPGDYPYDKGSMWVLVRDGGGGWQRAEHVPPLA